MTFLSPSNATHSLVGTALAAGPQAADALGRLLNLWVGVVNVLHTPGADGAVLSVCGESL